MPGLALPPAIRLWSAHLDIRAIAVEGDVAARQDGAKPRIGRAPVEVSMKRLSRPANRAEPMGLSCAKARGVRVAQTMAAAKLRMVLSGGGGASSGAWWEHAPATR